MTDYKFDIDGKQLSSDEIDKKKDFNAFHNKFQAQSKAFYQQNWFWKSTGLASIIIASLFFINSFGKNDSNNAVDDKIFEIVNERPFINPPFKDLKVKADAFKVDANKGGTFKSRFGSILKIPAFAFSRKNGKTIKDQTVEIRFTEYKDVADQIISGIPMTYDSAGTKYMFSSAGMVEIRGFIGDSSVNLNSQKSIQIEMQSAYSGTEYNFYCLNEKEKGWDYLGKDSVVDHSEEAFKKQIQEKYPEIQKKDIQISDNQLEAQLQRVPEYKKRKKRKVQIEYDLKQLTVLAPNKPIKADKEKEKFRLDILENENPELVSYKDVQFELAFGESINPKHINQNWNNVDIKKGEDNEVLITFSKLNSSQEVQYRAIPVLDGNAFENAHKAYLANLNNVNKKRSELKKVTQQIKSLKKEIKSKFIDKALIKAKLDRTERIAYIQLERRNKVELARLEQRATVQKIQLQNKNTQQKVTRYFSASNFGVFNCDKAIATGANKKSTITNIKFGEEVNEAVIIDVFQQANGIFSCIAMKKQVLNQYANSTITIGISKNQIGILKSTNEGELDFIVKGAPKSKAQLIEWLEL